MNDLEFYLKDINFDKQYTKYVKKLKNKKVIIYGAGKLFELIEEKYDLSKLNIIGVSDGKYTQEDEKEKFLSYKKIPVYNIVEHKPDYVLVATLKYMDIIQSLEGICLRNTKIKVRPLAKLPLIKMLKQIWS